MSREEALVWLLILVVLAVHVVASLIRRVRQKPVPQEKDLTVRGTTGSETSAAD